MKKEYTIKLIAPAGLGFGGGSITAESSSLETRKLVEQAINSDNFLVDIEMPGDGCADGRACKKVIDPPGQQGGSIRAKVFGGGAVMAAAAIIGKKSILNTFNAAYQQAITDLDKADVDYGAHSSDHTSKNDSGCGALDNTPAILENALKYQTEINNVISSLSNDSEQTSRIAKEVIANYQHFLARQSVTGEHYSGRDILKKIASQGKIIRELSDDHKEVAIVINMDIAGKTANQSLVRQTTSSQAQIFSLDIPRLLQITAALNKDNHDRLLSFVSMLVYSLATAATLTRGDLPLWAVYKNMPKLII